MQRTKTARRLAVAGLLLALSLLALACGDGDDSSATDGAPTLEEDTAAIEKLIVEFGASRGGEACDYYSADFIRSDFGSVAACRRQASDAKAVDYELDEARIDGDRGSAIVISPFSERLLVYPVVREGDDADAYDGWLIAGFYEKEGAVPEAAESPDEPPEPEEPEAPAPADPDAQAVAPTGESTPYANALGDATEYQTCIESEGVQGVGNQPFGFGGQPQITFEAGGASIVAVFASSAAEAQKASKAAGSGAPIVRVGSALLFTEDGAPPESDIGLAYDCAEQVTDG